LVSAISTWVDDRIGIVTISQIRPRVVVLIHDSGTNIKVCFTILKRTLGAFCFCSRKASCGTILHNTYHLFPEASYARHAQFQRLQHALFKTVGAFSHTIYAALKSNVLDKFSVLTDIL